jgi:two-component system cell cycle sensor histidine kinase/response regulator CckA
MASATGRDSIETSETVATAGEVTQDSVQSTAALPYEAVFDSMPEALSLWRIIRDRHKKPVDAECHATNAALRKLFGVSNSYSRRLSELDRSLRGSPDVLSVCTRVAKDGASEVAELHDQVRGRWYELRVSVAPDDNLLVAVADVTERRRIETAVQRLQYSIDNIDDYFTWVDSQGRIMDVSDSTCRHLEYTRDELLSLTVFDTSPELTPDRWSKGWATVSEQGTLRRETLQRTKSGRIFPVEMTVNHMIFDGQEYDCVFFRDISDRKRLEESLVLTQLSVEHAPDMIHWIDSEGHITYANRSTCDFLGYTLGELQSLSIWDISPRLTPEIFEERWTARSPGGLYLGEEIWRAKDGREMSVDISSTKILQKGRELGLSFVRDITQRKQAEQALRESEERLRQSFEAQNETLKALKEREEQLLHAQKMEAVGRLAGGIAHDFNNVLTTIIGYSDLLLSSSECPPGSMTDDICEIKAAAERAGALTKRILAFSRRQALQPRVLSLNTVVSDTERLLARTLGADIELRTSLSPDLGQVEVDEQQFVQVLLNLSVNARDAMPKGGSLTIETANVELGEQFCATHPETHPGRHVMITVTDTGTGMDPDVLAHVFEPFYTTKPPEQGTGLGLATVYGIIAQSGGCTYVQSELGRGTTFTVYLPRYDKPVEPEQADPATSETEGKSQVVMVVDSDNTFLALCMRILERRGYKVLPYGDAERALKALADVSARVDMLITDLVLSGPLQGGQLAAQAAKKRPGLPVLFMSRQARDTVVDTGQVDQQTAHLEKPFTAEELTRRVRTCLADA